MTADPTAAPRLARELVELYEEATRLDPRRVPPSAGAEALERGLVAPLEALLVRAGDAVGALQALCDGETPEVDDPLWDIDFDFSETTRNPGVPSLGAGLYRQVGDVCFTARGELRKAERGLRATGADHETRRAACESARRKLRRALVAILVAAERALGGDVHAPRDLDVELETGLAVRALYAKFRSSIPPCDLDAPASVRRALRFAAVAFAVMVGSDDFSELRLPDRAMLLALQRRIFVWARATGDHAEGARIYRDINTAADLLRAVNLRQELVLHDRLVVAELRATFAARTEGASLDGLLTRLGELRGRDDELDRLLRSASDAPADPDVARSIARALDRLAAELRIDEVAPRPSGLQEAASGRPE
jgi:hypothetical protein